MTKLQAATLKIQVAFFIIRYTEALMQDSPEDTADAAEKLRDYIDSLITEE